MHYFPPLQKKEPVGDESEPVPEAVVSKLEDLTRGDMESHVSFLLIRALFRETKQYHTNNALVEWISADWMHELTLEQF